MSKKNSNNLFSFGLNNDLYHRTGDTITKYSPLPQLVLKSENVQLPEKTCDLTEDHPNYLAMKVVKRTLEYGLPVNEHKGAFFDFDMDMSSYTHIKSNCGEGFLHSQAQDIDSLHLDSTLVLHADKYSHIFSRFLVSQEEDKLSPQIVHYKTPHSSVVHQYLKAWHIEPGNNVRLSDVMPNVRWWK